MKEGQHTAEKLCSEHLPGPISGERIMKQLSADAWTPNILNIVPGGQTQGSTNGASSSTMPWDHMSALDRPLYVLTLPRELPSWRPLLCDPSEGEAATKQDNM